jgi:hypothetical protein
LWRLDRIVSTDLLDRGFPRREDFLLSAYAAQSFRVFQEKPIDVVLRFTPDAAEDAARRLFHPSQSIVCEVDGGGQEETEPAGDDIDKRQCRVLLLGRTSRFDHDCAPCPTRR